MPLVVLAVGWSYHESQADYADTGVAGKPKNSGLLVHRSRGRVWFRVAATPEVAKEVEVRVPVPREVSAALAELPRFVRVGIGCPYIVC